MTFDDAATDSVVQVRVSILGREFKPGYLPRFCDGVGKKWAGYALHVCCTG